MWSRLLIVLEVEFNHWLTSYKSVELASRLKLVGENRGEMTKSTAVTPGKMVTLP